MTSAGDEPSSPTTPSCSLSFGGPESPDEVMPFLRRVTAGRGVPDERLAEVAEHYHRFGGRSPINDQNRALLARAARPNSTRRGIDLPVLWGNRNSEPYVADTLREARDRGPPGSCAIVTSRLLLATPACRQYREDLAAATEELGTPPPTSSIDKVRPYAAAPRLRRASTPSASSTRSPRLPDRDPATRPAPLRHPLGPRRHGRHLGPRRRRGQPLRRAAPRAGQPASPLGLNERARPRPSARARLLLALGRPAGQPWLEPDVNDRIEELAAEGVAHRRGRARSASSPTTWRSSTTSTPRPRDGRAGAASGSTASRPPAPTRVRRGARRPRSSSGPRRPAARSSSRRRPTGDLRPSVCATGCCPNLRAAKPALCGGTDVDASTPARRHRSPPRSRRSPPTSPARPAASSSTSGPTPSRSPHEVDGHRRRHRDGPALPGPPHRAACAGPAPTTPSSARRTGGADRAPAASPGWSTRSTAPSTTSTTSPRMPCRSPRWSATRPRPESGGPFAGAVFNPVTGELFRAAPGRRRWRLARPGPRAPLRPAACDPLDQALVATGFGYAAGPRERQGRSSLDLLRRSATSAGSAAPPSTCASSPPAGSTRTTSRAQPVGPRGRLAGRHRGGRGRRRRDGRARPGPGLRARAACGLLRSSSRRARGEHLRRTSIGPAVALTPADSAQSRARRAQNRRSKRYSAKRASAARNCFAATDRWTGRTAMATDYDAPRKTDDEMSEDSIEELKTRRVDKRPRASTSTRPSRPRGSSCPAPTCRARRCRSGSSRARPTSSRARAASSCTTAASWHPRRAASGLQRVRRLSAPDGGPQGRSPR